MIKVAICEDEHVYRERMKVLCHQYFAGKRRELTDGFSLKIYASGEELLAGDEADILLLDIELGGINGIQIKELFQKRRTETRILFITSHPEQIREAFGFNVFGFLDKPLAYEAFCVKMDQAVRSIQWAWKEICYSERGMPRKVRVMDILYVEARGKYAYLHMKDGDSERFSDEGIGWWKEHLAKDPFIMCHRSYLVNCSAMEGVGREKVILTTGEGITMSRLRQKDVKEGYWDYVRGSAR